MLKHVHRYCSLFGIDDAALALGAGQVLGAGLDLAGGFVSGGQNRQQLRHSDDMQREFAQNGIQWRVRDAKKAGISPLVALGSSPLMPFPQTMGDPSADSFRSAGQDLSRAASAMMPDEERVRLKLQNRLLSSQIDESDARAEAIRSSVSRGEREDGLGLRSEATGLEGSGQSPASPGAGIFKVNPSEVTTSSIGRSSAEAGLKRGEEVVEHGPGLPMIVPHRGGSSTEEVLREMGPLAYIGLLAKNMREFGSDWLPKYMHDRYGIGRDLGFEIIEPGRRKDLEDRGLVGRANVMNDDAVSNAIRRAVEKGKALADKPHMQGMKRQWDKLKRSFRNRDKGQ